MQHSVQNDRIPSKLNFSKSSHWFILLIYQKMKKLCLAYLKVWKIIIAHESIKISWQVKELNIFPKISFKSYCSLLKVLINAASNKNIMNEKKRKCSHIQWWFLFQFQLVLDFQVIHWWVYVGQCWSIWLWSNLFKFYRELSWQEPKPECKDNTWVISTVWVQRGYMS